MLEQANSNIAYEVVAANVTPAQHFFKKVVVLPDKEKDGH